MLQACLAATVRHPLAGFLAFFLIAAFFIPSQPAWAMLFYLVGLPLTLARLNRDPELDWRSPQVILSGLLIVWSLLTMTWGWHESPKAARTFGEILAAICTGAFFLGLLVSLDDEPRMADALCWIFIIYGATNAAIAFAMNFAIYRTDFQRFDGWAITRHQILGSMIFGQCYLFALDRSLREPRWRLWTALAGAVCLAFIIMTGSRGPLAAAIIASAFLLIGLTKRSGLLLLVAPVFCAIVAGLVMWFRPGLFRAVADQLWGRGASYRPQIWSFTLNRVAEHLWIGHGPAAELGMPRIRAGLEAYSFPHSFYLSALFYGGVVGLVLLLAVLGFTSVKLLGNAIRTGSPIVLALWVNVLIGGLTDLGQVADGPVHIWLIFWVPLTLASSRILDDDRRAKSQFPAGAFGGVGSR